MSFKGPQLFLGLVAAVCVLIFLIMAIESCCVFKGPITPRCAKIKCTAKHDVTWIVGEPITEKDFNCTCLVFEEERH